MRPLLDHPEIGSICSGGRYDNLAEYYTDKQLPGVGISIGLTRLFYVLGEQGMLNPDLPTAPADVLILPMTEDLSAAVTLATAAAGRRRADPALHRAKKVQGQDELRRQDRRALCGVPGRGRGENNVIACKDMTSGEQTTLDFAATPGAGPTVWPRGTRARSSWRNKRLTLRRKALSGRGAAFLINNPAPPRWWWRPRR